MAKLLSVRRYLHNVRSQSTSHRRGHFMSRSCEICLVTDRMCDVHMLHHSQSVPMLDETSALYGNMPQPNDTEVCKHPCLAFSPASSVWGQMGSAWMTVAEECYTPRKQSRRMTMLLSFINSSDSATTLPSLLLRTWHVPVSCISWVVKVPLLPPLCL
jgi:hypothetical protein